MRASQTQDKFIVRLPDGMREQISEAAAANNRSMTAEIVSRLARSFEQETSFSSARGDRIESEIETVRGEIRIEANERKRLEDRLARLENQFQAYALDDRNYHFEMRLRSLEGKIS
ncbi:Arc family DNA-binding protein [Rhizobium laguerreae]|uniref:Arc family DNA-binding protein n=1 Tax=Rhizobium laguerreae TaxID=1076926 RepID=A0AB35FN38_9HYPH|nr:Arc family DNA-binding protein [Rhizobium laguerreae]MBY3067068.1 Arc family DNA-binding protein [Rhizobium laguerreae]MBY3080067.1 Arc family DNA-binding protein [Rhizobium laguerreae]